MVMNKKMVILDQFDLQFLEPTLVTSNVSTAAAHLVVQQNIVSVEIVLFSLLNGARRYEPTTKKQQDVSDERDFTPSPRRLLVVWHW